MDAVQQISLFNMLFIVSAAVAGLGLLLAVFFFFFFDIRTVYALMTGRARKATIRRMAEQNAKTGNLRASSGMTGQTGAITADKPMVQHPAPGGQAQTAPLAAPGEEPLTGVLQVDAPETAVLQTYAPQTTVLGAAPAPEPEAGATTMLAHTNFGFFVTESTMVIHTDEMI